MALAPGQNHQLDMRGRRLVFVSNRLPFNVSVEGDRVDFEPSTGGLVTGLASFREAHKKASLLPAEHLWVGWPGGKVDGSRRERVIEQAQSRFQSFPVFL